MAEDFPYLVYLLAGAAVFLVAEAAFLSVSGRMSYTRRVNMRLRLAEQADSQGDVLVQLRRARSLSDDGRYALPLIWFNRLVMQSGTRIGVWRLVGLMCLAAAVAFLYVLADRGSPLLAALAAFVAGVVLPLGILKRMRGKRLGLFEAQLPDAVEIVVRSLRAGHPLPVAIAMVGRELPDPIGSEFGLTADELTYGLDLEEAVNNMTARVGQEDLALVVLAISIQAKSGGNLAEILSNLSRVLRARFKLRRRVRALSAEARFSALALSGLPFLVFGALMAMAPNFYGGIWEEPVVHKVLGFALALMMTGNLIMFRMVNFKL